MATPPPSSTKVVTAKESVEQVPVTLTETRVENTRFVIALIATVAFFMLLGVSLFLSPSPFESVAAALSGPIGLIWGYYFGTKSKTET